MVIKEVIEAAAKGVYAEHTQLSDIIREVQQENAHLKEKKARAEDHIRDIKAKLDLSERDRVNAESVADATAERCRAAEQEVMALRQRNSILEAAMAGFGAILRGVRP